MKKLLTALCFIGLMAFSANQANAQTGIKGGLNLANVKYDVSAMGFSMDETTDMRIGFHAGVFTNLALNDMLSIQLEALYTIKGSKEEEEFFGDTFEIETELAFVEVPVLLRFNVPIDGDTRPYLLAGGHVGYLLDATESEDGQSIDISDELNEINFGASFGAGVSFGSFFIEGRYDLGLANLADVDMPDADFKATANAIMFSGGVQF